MTPVPRLLPVLATLVALTLPAAGPARAARAVTPAGRRVEPIRGVTLGLFYPEERAGAESSLARIASLGATHVALVVPLEQRDVFSDSVYADSSLGPSDSLLVRLARAARERGLGVIVFPLLHLHATGPKAWRGTLRPSNWAAWFDSYGAALERCAAVAREGRAEWLCAGAELVSSEGHSARWARVLRRVRAAFPGRIFYSQNWDHARPLGFRRSLDAVGLNAYFELTQRADPPLGTLLRAWRGVRARLAASRRQEGEPVFFTEVGYPCGPAAAGRPWDYGGPGPARPELQARCFEAFFRAWNGCPRMRGALVYMWSEAGDGLDAPYSIRGKPAEATVARWFRAGFPGAPREGR